MSECYRVALTYADGERGPASVVLKCAAADPSSQADGAGDGPLRAGSAVLYRHRAGIMAGPRRRTVPSRRLRPATGAFDLLLGDAAPAVVGDEIGGATIEQATMALTQLGRVHGPLLGDAALAGAEWLNRESPLNQGLIAALYAGFLERYRDDIAPEHRDVCERLVASFDDYLAAEAASERPQGLIHGDYRLDNMLFGRGRCRTSAHRRRLADRHLGSGADRRRLLPRLRAAGSGSGATHADDLAARVPRRPRTRRRAHPRRRPRRRAARRASSV